MRLFRIVHSDSTLNPLGAYRPEGRYHATMEEAKKTSYLSAGVDTCLKEVSHHLGGTVPLRNRVCIQFDVALERVVDLTDPKQRSELGLDAEELVGEEWAPLQGVARILRRKGVQGLIVPSARDPQGKNVVLFLENIEPGAIRKIEETPI